jgi:hypothetical protein
MEHESACEVNEWHSIQYNSFGEGETPDDGRLRPKHCVKSESGSKE